MNAFELYDKVNRKTWIFQAIIIIALLFVVFIRKFIYIDSENKFYVLLFIAILFIKALLFIACFIVTKIKEEKK